ncbi:MAG: DUF86 domain-containing protein [Bacteroidota bacterium]
MSKRGSALLLEDIAEASKKILRYTAKMDLEMFLKDQKTMDAVIRNFEIIGEAANRIDVSFQNRPPEIPWARIRGLRKRIVHDYFGVDYHIVWSIVEKDLVQRNRQILTLVERQKY